MRYILLLLFVFALTHLSFAINDTLTRAQVYNFNVGDTFDYYWAIGPLSSGSVDGPFQSSGYIRKVVTGVHFSVLSDTLFIEEQTLYPTPVEVNNLIITNLGSYAIYQDTITDMPCTPSYSVDSYSVYNQRIVNGVFKGCFETSIDDCFANGLGRVYSRQLYLRDFGDDPSIQTFKNDTILVFYSKGGERWGIPMTIDGIKDISPQQKFISVYPTINSGNFTIVTEDNTGKMQLQLYDILGRSIQSQIIYGGKNEVCVANATPGIYLWNISDASSSQSGKIIIQ